MLVEAAYGKSSVRLVRIARHGDRHDLRDLTVAIRFEGAYEESYTAGDNTGVLPTDTMKNTVYAIARQDPIEHVEAFALRLRDRLEEPELVHVRQQRRHAVITEPTGMDRVGHEVVAESVHLDHRREAGGVAVVVGVNAAGE